MYKYFIIRKFFKISIEIYYIKLYYISYCVLGLYYKIVMGLIKILL